MPAASSHSLRARLLGSTVLRSAGSRTRAYASKFKRQRGRRIEKARSQVAG
jgi:hypothetical protein